MITAKTGEAGKSNHTSFVGARFAVDEINRNGGILGRPVELLEYDNQSTPEGSAQAARKAVDDGAAAVVGCNWSSHSLAMARVLQPAGVPMITHTSTNESVTRVGDYIFRACFTDAFQGLGMARFAYERLECSTAVVLIDGERTYSRGLGKAFSDAFERLGGRVVMTATYSASGDVDYDALVREVVRLAPGALFVPGGFKDVSAIFVRARAAGYTGHRLSGDGIGIRLYDIIGSKADDIYFSSHWTRWVDTPKSKDFVRRFEAAAAPAQEDTYALVYDSFTLLKDAMERAGTTDGPEVRDALAATTGFEGVTGAIRFNDNGDPIKPMVINQLKFGGMLFVEQIYP
jgi:branched-chain amino acid transport system substrate-binding protein